MNKNIFFFYTGGLKREINIINNISIEFKNIYLFSIDSKINKISYKSNLKIKKILILKIFLYFISKIEKISKLNSLIQLITLVFIDIIYSLILLFVRTKPGDLVVCENNICSFLLLVSKFKNLKSVLDVSNTHIQDKYNYIVKSRGYKLDYAEKIIIGRGLKEYKRANNISVLSTNVWNSFNKFDEKYLKKILVINSGIDIDIFKRQKVDNEYSICIVGAVSKLKNSHKLFKMIDSIKNIKLKILIIGNFDHTLNKIEIFNHYFKHIKYLEPNRLPYYYSLCNILCIASLIEGMPKVVLEACSCGLPVIGFEGSSISDIINNYENGFVVNNDDFLSFKKKLIYSLDKKNYKSLSKNATKTIKAKFSINHYADRWNSQIKSIL